MKRNVPSAFSGGEVFFGNRKTVLQKSTPYLAYTDSMNTGFFLYSLETQEHQFVETGKQVFAVAGFDDGLYLGLEGGLYFQTSGSKAPKEVAESHKAVLHVSRSHDQMYFATSEQIYSYNPKTSAQDTALCASEWISELAAGGDGRVYFVRDEDNIDSVDGVCGGTQKHVSSVGFITCMTWFNGLLYFGGLDNRFWSYSPRTGEQKQIAEEKNPILYVLGLGDSVYFTSWKTLYSYNTKTCKTTEIAEVDSTISSMVALDDILYFSEGETIYLYKPQSGCAPLLKTGKIINRLAAARL